MKLTVSPILMFLVLASCSQSVPANDPTSIRQAPVNRPDTCAFGVKDAVASVEDRENGIALTIVSRNNVAEVRTRVRSAAEMRGAGSHQGPGHEGQHGTGDHHGLQGMQLPPARVWVEDVDQGARVLLTATDPAEAPRLRSTVRDRALRMNAGCP
jgi:hypothetical protein